MEYIPQERIPCFFIKFSLKTQIFLHYDLGSVSSVKYKYLVYEKSIYDKLLLNISKTQREDLLYGIFSNNFLIENFYLSSVSIRCVFNFHHPSSIMFTYPKLLANISLISFRSKYVIE